MQESILTHRNYLYLKVAVSLSLLAVALYALSRPLSPRGGDTWLGYALGIAGAALIVWLTALGVRKRRYGGGGLPLKDWVSAHVYLGLSLVVVASLHAGFQFGWNVHAATYVLMLATIGSGVIGLVIYQRYPRALMDNQKGEDLDTLLQSIADIDGETRALVGGLSDASARAVFEGIAKTRIGGSLFDQFAGARKEGAALRTLDTVRALGAGEGVEHAREAEQLVRLLRHKCELVARAQDHVRIRALLRIWLYVHVPMSLALFVALIGHVASVFFYR
jgi:hypothetical protein